MDEVVNLVISYNMKPGQEAACHQYIVGTIGATLNQFGFRFCDAWYTIWGNGPQVTGIGQLDNLEIARELLDSELWQDAVAGLQPYADDFRVRVLQASGSFQL